MLYMRKLPFLRYETSSAVATYLQHILQKRLGALVLRRNKEGFGRALLDDVATVHEDDAAGDFAGKRHFGIPAQIQVWVASVGDIGDGLRQQRQPRRVNTRDVGPSRADHVHAVLFTQQLHLLGSQAGVRKHPALLVDVGKVLR